MMNTSNSLIVSTLKKNKKRTLATVIGIVLTCTLLFSVSIAFSTIEFRGIENAKEFSGSHHVVFKEIPYLNGYRVLKNDSDVKDFFVLQDVDTIFFNELGYEESVYMTIRSYDGDFDDKFLLANGRYPQKKGEIMISSEVSQNGSYKIGDKLAKYEIVGIYNKSFLGSEYAHNGDHMTYRPISYTYASLDENNTKSHFFVFYKSHIDAYKKIEADASKLELEYSLGSLKDFENVVPNKTLLSAYGQKENRASQMKMYLFLAIILYVLSLFCAIIIYNSFAISITERKKTFGILRSIGASKRQIMGLVIKEVAIIGLLSIPLAFLISLGLVGISVFIVNRILETSIALHVYVSHMVVALFFILFTLFISAVTPARKAGSISPMEAIKGSKDFKIAKSKERYPFIKRLFGLEGEVAFKNIKRNGKKFNATLLSLSISIVLFITISTFINYLIKNVDATLNEEFDVIVYSIDNDIERSKEFIEKVKNIKYVDDIVISKSAFLFASDRHYRTSGYAKSDSSTITVAGLDQKSYDRFKKELQLESDEVILYNYYRIYNEDGTYETDKAYIDSPTIDICQYENGTGCYFRFESLYTTSKNYLNTFDSPTIVLDIDRFDEYVDEFIGEHPGNFSSVSQTYSEYLKNSIKVEINSKNYRKFDEEMRKLLDKNTDLDISYSNLALENDDTIRQYIVIKLVLYAVLAFIALISVVGMLNSINTNLNLREMEFAVLRSIGFDKKSIAKMIRLENIFLVAKSLVIGISISIGVIVGIRLVSSIRTFPGSTPDIIPFPWMYIFIVVIVVVLIIFITSQFSIKKIESKNIIDSIRKDSI